MKLFQKLLLAPAALGLLAPVAANAADVNIAGLSQYGTEEQVTSITQFSDVQPTDWAYQALSNLIERYGCVAGYPNGTYRGNRAMTRYEAAALLNACLDRITEVTDELKRLMKEFERELAVLRGRVDGLEARVGELEATQFSTTTKLRGLATFVVGGNSFSGTQYGNPVNTVTLPGGVGGFGTAPGIVTPTASSGLTADGLPMNPNQANAVLGIPNSQSNRRTLGATTFNYDVRLILDSSFTGSDLLRTVLRAGNFLGANGSAYGQGLTFLETAFEEPAGDNVVGINRLFYNFPVGKSFSVTVGPRVRVDDAGMLGMWPSVYPADTVLDFFTYAGSPGAYNLNGFGGGAGLTYSDVLGAKGVTLSTNYVSSNAGDGNPNNGGLMTEGSSSASVTQLAYTGGKFPVIGGSAWGLAAAYTYAQNMGLPSGTILATRFGTAGSNNSVGISGYWVPENTGWIPSVSTGWGTTASESSTIWNNTKWARSNSWYLGLQWPDTFVKGNDLGMAVGQAPFMTTNGGGNSTDGYAKVAGTNGNLDSNYMWEWWYKFQVTDNITVTPALYYIQNYDGQIGKINISNGQYNASSNVFGGLLKTTFKF
ncbi:iron uptake porin [Synechococcus sp. NB0720_010]|uniref:iron uptake porin n=1 Tax=Synechococcus sp. NB0720_010 TaxID=2907159 RepID=UPI001FF93100|nr:iron uptake porin [Synechococcus sp. NB0720_010]UPH89608.1 iron uptake porin [Synechococcus sp. NB0720_010]